MGPWVEVWRWGGKGPGGGWGGGVQGWRARRHFSQYVSAILWQCLLMCWLWITICRINPIIDSDLLFLYYGHIAETSFISCFVLSPGSLQVILC